MQCIYIVSRFSSIQVIESVTLEDDVVRFEA